MGVENSVGLQGKKTRKSVYIRLFCRAWSRSWVYMRDSDSSSISARLIFCSFHDREAKLSEDLPPPLVIRISITTSVLAVGESS